MLAWSCLALVGMLHGPGACVARHGACSSRAAITRMEKEFSASELKSAGFPAAKLQAAGFTAEQLKEAGYSAMELLNDAQYEEQAVLDAGYSKAEVEEAGSKALLARGVSAPTCVLAALLAVVPQPLRCQMSARSHCTTV